MSLKLAAILISFAIATPAAAESAWVATSYGAGPLKIGMTAAQVEAALGKPLNLTADGRKEIETCGNVAIPDQPGASMMFENGRLSSIAFTAPSAVKTARGIGIGATIKQVTTAYPGVTSDLSDYAGDGDPQRMLTFWAEPQKYGIRFLTNTSQPGSIQKVDLYRVGTKSIAYMEGCL